MTEAEALKRFIPILGQISTPVERATIARNILERIAGQQASVMGVSHKQAGALAWPNNHVKALTFERALDAAVDAGEFVSFIHRTDRRHFQIEELAAWPNCPKIDAESPLTFWLSDTAQTAATSASVKVDDAPEKEVDATKKAALISNLEYEWSSIEADISEATRNGLKAAAHTGKHGEWDADKARAWAVSKGKIKQTAPVNQIANAWNGATTRHTIRH